MRCVIPLCASTCISLRESLQNLRRYGSDKSLCLENLEKSTVQWRSCPNSSIRSTPTWRPGWSSQTYTPHSTSAHTIPANTDILHIDMEPRYTSALQSLSHVLVLTPQNPFYVLQAGETAYTAQDIPLAMRFFLTVIEMTGDDNDSAVPPPPTGITIRAWYGVELVSLLTCATQH